MSEEYIIEIEHKPEPFRTVEEAADWAKKNIKKKVRDGIINVVSRDITVVNLIGGEE